MITASTPPSQPRSKGLVKRAGHAAARVFLNWCIARVDGEIATTNRLLAIAEEDLGRAALPPEVRADIQREADGLQERLNALHEEAAYIQFQKDSLAESEGACPCAATP